MGFDTGNISSLSPTTALITKIETLLTANAAWVFVEEWTEGGYTNRVWKNLGTQNGWGQDFYLALMRTSVSSVLYIKVSEGYNATTHVAKRGNAAGNVVLTAEATYASAFGEAEYAWSNANWGFNIGQTVSTGGFYYAVLVTKAGVFVYTSSTVNPTYAGLFDPFWSSSLEFPLATLAVEYASYGGGSFTRLPANVGVSLNRAFSTFLGVNDATYSKAMHLQWPMGKLGGGGVLAGTSAFGAELAVQGWTTGQNFSEPRGRWRDLLVFRATNVITPRDTITVDGKVWFCVYAGTWSYGLGLGTEYLAYFINTEAV